MPVISIRERNRTTDRFEATVRFDDQGEYQIAIRSPFSEQEEERLEWYFEQYLRFPFVRQVEAQAAPTIGSERRAIVS